MTRFALPLLLILFVSPVTSAEDGKIDTKLLAGRWEPKAKGEGAVVIEFTADGRMVILVTAKGKDIRIEGTYAVEGNKLTTRSTAGDTKVEETRTIDRLSDAELVTTGPKGTDTLIRAKDKK